jgi:hypothetical protein
VDIRCKIGTNKKEGPGANARSPSENAVGFDYFSEELIALKLVVNAVPTPFTAAMIAIAIPAAINAYSMAVAADSSRKNVESIAFMALCPASSPFGTGEAPCSAIRNLGFKI